MIQCILLMCIFWFVRKNMLSLFMATHVWKHNFWISSQVANPQALQVWKIPISYKSFTADTRQMNFSEWRKNSVVLQQYSTSQATAFITYMRAYYFYNISTAYYFYNRFISHRPKCLLWLNIYSRIHNIILHSLHSSIFSSFCINTHNQCETFCCAELSTLWKQLCCFLWSKEAAHCRKFNPLKWYLNKSTKHLAVKIYCCLSVTLINLYEMSLTQCYQQ
jgi:hypothetical protein